MTGGLQVTKPLPLPSHTADDEEVFVHEFSREDVRELIHIITKEIKIKGTKTPLVFLSFRSQVNNETLTEFLAKVFPSGARPAPTKVIERAVSETDELTLVASLKYLWARLPGSCVVGWDCYETFKKLEAKNDYSKKAFLQYMPQCLVSPSHSSIVYDFLELLVALGGDSKANQLSGRKIAKMAGIWAFQGPPPKSLSLNNSEPVLSQANSFTDGLNDWLPAAGAMFHLLLSFLRSMLPEDANTKLQLPRALQALLASNAYPPPDVTFSSSTLVHIPLVTMRTNSLSKSPVELLNKVPKVLNFEDQSLFEAKEDYALLKSLCRNDDNILNKLSAESRRIIEVLCGRDHPSNLNAGWIKTPQKNQYGPTQVEVNVSRVSIDDYFIWTWLATMSFEQTGKKKSTFGRSLISEVVFDGFKKWIIIEEQNINLNIRNSKAPSQDNTVIKTMHQPMYTSMLDGLPDASPSSRPKKQKPKPKPKPVEKEEKPLPAPGSQSPETESKSRSIMNTLKKLNQNHHNHTNGHGYSDQQYQAQPPLLPKKDSFKIEPVEGLPEIEREQYRLSIPLDSIGFENDSNGNFDQYLNQQYSCAPLQYEQDRYEGRYDEYQQPDPQQYQYQYQQQQPQPTNRLQEPVPSYPAKSGHAQTSMLSPELPAASDKYPNLRPEPVHRPVDEFQQAVSNYADPNYTPGTYQEPLASRPGTLDNQISNVNGLTNMVDQIKIHVNDVEKSLEVSRESPVPSAVGYDVEVPLPSSKNDRNDYRTEVHEKVEYEIYGRGGYEDVGGVSSKGRSDDVKKHIQREQTSSADTSYHSMVSSREATPPTMSSQDSKIKPERRKPLKINTTASSGLPDSSSSTPAVLESASSSYYASTPSISVSTPKEHEMSQDISAARTVSGYKSMIDEVEVYETPASTIHASPARVENREQSPVREYKASPQRALPSSPKKEYGNVNASAYPGDDFIDTYRAPSVYFQKGSVPIDLENYESSELPKDLFVANEKKHADLPPVPKKDPEEDVVRSNVRSQERNHTVVDSGNVNGQTPYSASPDRLQQRQQLAQQQQQQQYPMESRSLQSPYTPTKEPYQHPAAVNVTSPNGRLQNRSPQQNTPAQPQRMHRQQSPQIVNRSTPSPSRVQAPPQTKLTVQGRTDLSPQGKVNDPMQQDQRNDRYLAPQQQQSQQSQQQNQHQQHQQFRGQMSPNRSMTSETSPYRGTPTRQAGPPGSENSSASGAYFTPANGSTPSLPPASGPSARRQSPQQGAMQYPPHPNRGRSPQQQNMYTPPPPQGTPTANYYPSPSPQQQQQQQPYYPPPPQGYYPPPAQGYPAYPPPPQGYYPPPPQGYPPQGYPPQGYPPQGYYPPPPSVAGVGGQRPPSSLSSGASSGKPSTTASDFAIGNQPAALGKNKLHHNAKGKKKDLRNALTQGDFGI